MRLFQLPEVVVNQNGTVRQNQQLTKCEPVILFLHRTRRDEDLATSVGVFPFQ